LLRFDLLLILLSNYEDEGDLLLRNIGWFQRAARCCVPEEAVCNVHQISRQPYYVLMITMKTLQTTQYTRRDFIEWIPVSHNFNQVFVLVLDAAKWKKVFSAKCEFSGITSFSNSLHPYIVLHNLPSVAMRVGDCLQKTLCAPRWIPMNNSVARTRPRHWFA
jgi:hypothetical protein